MSGWIISYSKAAIKISARVGPNGEPTDTPSICLYIYIYIYSWPFIEQGVLMQVSNNSFFNVCFPSEVVIRLSLLILSKMMLMTVRKGMFVKI